MVLKAIRLPARDPFCISIAASSRSSSWRCSGVG
jgi:hypothetical protein